MRVIVTGGAGFIGANLCKALADRPEVEKVTALDDLSTGFRENVTGTAKVELIEGSILDRGLLDKVVAGADTVVHLAARPSVPRSLADPVRSHEVNTTGTVHVLEAARASAATDGRGPHVIVASSSSVYGANTTLPKQEDLQPRPMSPYAATKLATESYALAWAHSFGTDALAFRFFNVFGPLQAAGHAYAAVVPAFVSAALEGRPLPVHGDGGQTRDFTYVGSVVTVITEAVLRRVSSPQPVNLAFGSRVSLLELVDTLSRVIGHDLPVEHLPPRAGDVRDSQADQSALRKLFPAVQPVPLDDGLTRTVSWFRSLA